MTNLEIIKRLKTAKDLYDKDTKPGSDKNGGMCHYMKQAFNGVFKEGIPPSYNELVALIPEFNPEFLGGNVKQEEVARLVFWWPVAEKKHRLIAFDKLIHWYTERINKHTILLKAKKLFEDHSEYWGMCFCIEHAMAGTERGINIYDERDVVAMFPEFNREFLGAPKDRYGKAFWWTPDDEKGHNARIEAFDKLIKYYEGR